MHFALCKRALSPARHALEEKSHQTRIKIETGDASLLMGGINQTRPLEWGSRESSPPRLEAATSVHLPASAGPLKNMDERLIMLQYIALRRLGDPGSVAPSKITHTRKTNSAGGASKMIFNNQGLGEEKHQEPSHRLTEETSQLAR